MVWSAAKGSQEVVLLLLVLYYMIAAAFWNAVYIVDTDCRHCIPLPDNTIYTYFGSAGVKAQGSPSRGPMTCCDGPDNKAAASI